jgi:proteasome lid subunit RPN8/RPN11
MWESKRFTPADSKNYIIPNRAILYTEKVLSDYRRKRPSNEGLVYWAGRKDGDIIRVELVIAPRTDSAARRVVTTPESNLRMIQVISKHDLIHLGQVHSHPGSWVDHSEGDDEYAAFKINGLLSLVVPSYCKNGMIPIETCGIHRFEHDHFIRFTDRYVKDHFSIEESNCFFEDLRDERV